MRVFQEPAQGTDADRFMIWRIAKSGPIVIGREVGLYYRLHSDNACARMESEDLAFHRRSWLKNLERMLNEAAAMGIDAKAEWQKTFGDADLSGVAMSQYPMTVACRNMLRERWGPVRQLRYPYASTRFLKTMARELLPPILHRGLSRIYGLLK